MVQPTEGQSSVYTKALAVINFRYAAMNQIISAIGGHVCNTRPREPLRKARRYTSCLGVVKAEPQYEDCIAKTPQTIKSGRYSRKRL